MECATSTLDTVIALLDILVPHAVKIYWSAKTKMEAVTRSALTFLVATAVHAKQGLLNLPQMEALVVILMSVEKGAMTAVRSVSTLLDHTTATVTVDLS
ncbi:hypothetical protein GBAR_LOCUS30776 [Geodia barretti]|uniref:Uncharacterized protein n=1 Tax=Geodia barretti TaxID=519541 RepID=A0AA35TZ32_GEOBA|nr:hypothetical protein GBAR_LOCUS30776 [Geodia barretti]